MPRPRRWRASGGPAAGRRPAPRPRRGRRPAADAHDGVEESHLGTRGEHGSGVVGGLARPAAAARAGRPGRSPARPAGPPAARRPRGRRSPRAARPGPLRVGKGDEGVERGGQRARRLSRREDRRREEPAGVHEALARVEAQPGHDRRDGVVGHGQEGDLHVIQDRGRFRVGTRSGHRGDETLAPGWVTTGHRHDRPAGGREGASEHGPHPTRTDDAQARRTLGILRLEAPVEMGAALPVRQVVGPGQLARAMLVSRVPVIACIVPCAAYTRRPDSSTRGGHTRQAPTPPAPRARDVRRPDR